jgi:isopenicillin N synthase-like dioxygenase
MTLVDFQQALADMVSSPDFCRLVRSSPELLRSRYALSDLEYSRLVTMANDRAMGLNCMLYRANRLAPLALNLHDFCTLLGPRLGPLLTEYSAQYPNTNVHFYRECDRFCQFMLDKFAHGYALEPEALSALETAHARIKEHLVASYTMV